MRIGGRSDLHLHQEWGVHHKKGLAAINSCLRIVPMLLPLYFNLAKIKTCLILHNAEDVIFNTCQDAYLERAKLHSAKMPIKSSSRFKCSQVQFYYVSSFQLVSCSPSKVWTNPIVLTWNEEGGNELIKVRLYRIAWIILMMRDRPIYPGRWQKYTEFTTSAPLRPAPPSYLP